MSSFLSRINSKTGQVLNLNPDNPQPVSINNGLLVSGQTSFTNGLSVSQTISTEGYIYNSLTAGIEEVSTDLRVVNKRTRPDTDAVVRKLGSYKPIDCGNNSVNGIAWSSKLKLFVIATSGTSPRISSDGISWTAPNSYDSVSDPVICWSPELSIFVVGNGASTDQPFRTNSTPASTSWVTRPTSVLSSSYSIYSIVWSPELSLFVATTDDSIILTSSDGLTWDENSVAFISSTFKHNLVWSSELGMFVVSAGSSIYYSYDGINWSVATGVTATNMVAWSPTIGHFVSVYVNSYHTSRDGINWTSRGTNITTYFLKWIDDLEMFIGQDASINTSYSYDGVNWNSLSTITIASDLAWSKELSSLILISATNPNVYLYGPILPSVGASLLANPSYLSINNTTGNLTVANSSYLSTTSGSVGIGNSSPGYKLDVTGTGRFTDTFSLTKASGNSLVVSSTDSSNSSIISNSISTLGGIGITGNSFFSSTTDSSSITTGAVVFSGGLGIAKKLFVGTDTTLGTSTTGILSLPNTTLSGTVLSISNATDSTSSTSGSVTLAGGLGVAKKLFVGTDTTLGTSTTGILSLPNTTLSGTVLSISNATDSTSSTSGSVTLAGGLGVAKKLFVGTDTTLGTSTTGILSLPNTTLSGTVLSISNATDSTSSTSGSVTLAGGLGVAKNIHTTGTIIVENATPSITIKTTGSTGGAVYLGNSSHGLARLGTNVTMYTTSGFCTLRTTGVDRLVQGDVSTDIVGTTASTTTTTGALIVRGGAGIVGSINSNSIDTTSGNAWSYLGGNSQSVDISGIRPGFGFGWNVSGGQGENIMTYYTGAGSNTRFDLCSWNGTTRTVRMTIDYFGNIYAPGNVAISSSVNGQGSSFSIVNSSSGTGAYSIAFIGNDTANKLVTFLNSSTRTIDGGINTATIRNDAGALRLQGSGQNGIFVATNGNVTIGNATVQAVRTLDVENSLRIKGATAFLEFGTASDINLSRSGNDLQLYTNSDGQYQWYIGITNRMTLNTTGLNIVGALSKGSGTFDIKHPTLLEKRLVHSFIEGPRCDLIYRGTKNLINGQALINLDKECTNKVENGMTEGTFVALCSNPVKYLHNNSSFSRVIGSISGNILTIICEDPQSSDTIDWMVIAERKDTFIKEWNRTDGDGELVTQYDTPN